jgi:8-oxo-dGTP diphosphatase
MYTKNINTHLIEFKDYFKVAISVDCVVFGFAEDKLKVLLIKSDLDEYKGKWSLLGDIVHPDEELDRAAYRILHDRTGLKDIYLEQVQTFGAVERHPGGRVVTVAYYSVVDLEQAAAKTTNAGLHWAAIEDTEDMAFDHRQILLTSVHKLQQQMMAQPIGFNLLPKKFSLRTLQSLYESVFGRELDRRNFRKKFMAMDLLEDLHEEEVDVRHRPAKLYEFNFKKYEQHRKRYIGLTF